MGSRYFSRRWEESRGDAFDSWGRSAWYFEFSDGGEVHRQIQAYDDGPTLRYDRGHPEDEYGFLSAALVEEVEWSGSLITKADFEAVWFDVVGIGALVEIGGGYDYEPAWLSGREAVTGQVIKWIPRTSGGVDCVVFLEKALTATGDVRGRRETRTGRYLVLGLRYAEQRWERTGTVHVELCNEEPAFASWADRVPGAWVESHATYRLV